MFANYIIELIKEEKRVDNRSLDEIREIKVETGIIERAEGSARVKFGDTEVIVGVKLDVGEPFPDTPDQGILITSAELSPVASPDFEPGISENAIELARVVDRCIRGGRAIDLDKLCIEEGEKVWMVFVDIQVVNHRGNLMDASALGAIAALMNTRLPKYEERVIRGEYKGKLPILHKPLLVTIGKIGDKLFVDPYIDEEKVAEAMISIGVREDDMVCAIQKQGSVPLTLNEIDRALDIAIRKSKELRKHLK